MNKSRSPGGPINRSIVLVGMMGAGKTCVGKKLATLLGMSFFDSDAVIEDNVHCTIAEYFAQNGEEKFRQIEAETVLKLLDLSPCVISLGGGAFINNRTREQLLKRSITIWLKADIDVLLDRALRHKKRPLLNDNNPRERMREILKSRELIYQKAAITIESDNRPIGMTAARVLKSLEDYLDEAKE